MTLRLASYNIRKCMGLDRRRDPGRVVDVINDLDADIIALQEADRRMGTRPSALPLDLLKGHSDFSVAPLAVEPGSLGWHGNALLIGPGAHLRETARIDLPGLEPRGAVLAEFDGTTGPFRIVGVHLGLIRRYRQKQLAAVREAIAARPDMPTIILGDFNEWSPDKGLDPLGSAFTVHSPGRTFHAARPIAALDRFALNERTTLLDAGVTETALSRVASDHLPVWADVRFETRPR